MRSRVLGLSLATAALAAVVSLGCRTTAAPAIVGFTSTPIEGLNATTHRLPDGSARLEVHPLGLRLVVPPSLTEVVYVGPALADVRECTDKEWDPEFNEITNGVLPFERLVAHFAEEPFCGGGSYADPHVRVYLLDEDVDTAFAKMVERAPAAVFDVTARGPERNPDSDPTSRPRIPKGWRTLGFGYPRFYGDYGAFAQIDMLLRRMGSVTVAVVVWSTMPLAWDSDEGREDPIADLLSSVAVRENS